MYQGLDLTLPGGQFIGVVGTSGSGKSSLLNLLLRLYDPCQAPHKETNNATNGEYTNYIPKKDRIVPFISK